MSSSEEENVYKLKEFSICRDGPAEADYNAKDWKVEDLIKSLKINIIHIKKSFELEEPLEIEFDMVGVGAPIANAIRRILIAEVPSMAIDRVHVFNNTSIIPDEVLSHRLGLIPIKVDPRLFEYRDPGDEGQGTEEDTLQFELKVKCTRKLNVSKEISGSDENMLNNSRVKSGDLKFVPIGNQKKMYVDIRPVHEDILLAVLKAGHEIDLQAFCFKNIGREHAKFSPVVVASYRLLPQIKLLEEISGERAHTLAKCFPKGVVKVSRKKDREVAKIIDSRKANCSRNVFLHEELKNAVEVSKVKDNFIFTVESVGALPPEVLVTEAINILKEKCRCFLKELSSLKI